jgi:hypothetical protein
MALGGFQEILNMFHKSLGIISHKHADKLSKFEKNFLDQMLKLIRTFVIAAYSINEQDESEVLDVIELVRSRSSNQPEVVEAAPSQKDET